MSRTVVADLRYEMTGLAARLARLGIVVDEDLEHLAETVTRTGSQPADIVCYFHHIAGGGFYGTVRKYEFVL